MTNEDERVLELLRGVLSIDPDMTVAALIKTYEKALDQRSEEAHRQFTSDCCYGSYMRPVAGSEQTIGTTTRGSCSHCGEWVRLRDDKDVRKHQPRGARRRSGGTTTR